MKPKKVRKPKGYFKRGEPLYYNYLSKEYSHKTIYIGGDKYGDTQQIHLTVEEAKRLHIWLGQFLKWSEK